MARPVSSYSYIYLWFYLLRTNMKNVNIADHALGISQFPLQPSAHKRSFPFDVPTADGSCSCLLEMALHCTNFYLHLVCYAASRIDRQQQTVLHGQWEPSFAGRSLHERVNWVTIPCRMSQFFQVIAVLIRVYSASICNFQKEDSFSVPKSRSKNFFGRQN